jgi:hypothetical protein
MTSERHLDDARCADHVLGLLPPEAAARDLEHAAACPGCEARLRAHAAAHDRARARERAGLAVRGRVVRPVVPGWRTRATVGIAAAAALTVALGAPWLLRRGAREERAFTWLPTGGGSVQRGDGTDPHLAAGLEAYARHDAFAAERELSLAKASGSAEAARRLFLASTALARGDTGRAIELLESVNFDTDVPEPWHTAGLRLLESAWRRAGRYPQADSLARALHARGTDERP